MISVVVPIYKTEAYIEACIRSLCLQNSSDFELILVDDGSPDRSAELAEAVLQEFPKISYQMIRTENRGVSAARNTGLSACSGEWVLMVDSDDIVEPGFLACYEQMLRLDDGNDLYSSGFHVEEAYAAPSAEQTEPPKVLTAQQAQIAFFDRTIRFLLPTLMIRRSFLSEHNIRFDEAVRYSEDVQFIWRCLAYNQKSVLHAPAENYCYLLHGDSTMTASGIRKILTGYQGLERLIGETKGLYCGPVDQMLSSRMSFSLLHGASKMLSAKDFKSLYRQADCAPEIRRQAANGSLKIRLTALALWLCPTLGYRIMRKH